MIENLNLTEQGGSPWPQFAACEIRTVPNGVCPERTLCLTAEGLQRPPSNS